MSKQDVNEAIQYLEGSFTIDNNGIVIVNHDGIILRVNPAFTKILGYEEHEIVGKPFSILAYKSQKMQKITAHNSLHRFYCSENSSMEMTLFDKQGHDIPVRFRSVLMRDKQGQIKQAIGMIEHMVELTGTGEGRSSLTEKMWEAQQNFENVLNASADAIILCDISGNIMMANKAFSQMLDYHQEEVMGKHIVEFTAFEEGTYITSTGEKVTIDEEYVIYTASRSAELFEKGCISGWESYLVKKDKVHIPAEITMSVLKDMDGERRGSLVILRDITERKKAEVETKKARDFLENIFKTSVDGIMVTNKGRITMVNEAIEKMTGYSKDEIIGKHTFVFSPEGEAYQEKGKELVEKLFKEGTVVGEEMTWLKKDGSFLDVEVSAALLKDDKSNITSVSSVRDITGRKKIEKEIKEAKEFLENVLESSIDGIVITDNRSNILTANSAMGEMTHFTKEEMVGKHTSELLMEGEDTTHIVEKIVGEFYEKGSTTFETKHKTKDGNIINVECSLTMVRDDKGEHIAGISIIRDITERKTTEEALKISEEKYRSVVENANDGIYSTNEEGIILSFNKKAEEIFGYSSDEIVGKSFLVTLPPYDREKHLNWLGKYRGIKSFLSREPLAGKSIKKNGQEIYTETTYSAIEVGGKIIIYCIVREVTERKKMEQQLLQSEKLKSLGELSGGVAHDFNNVLAAILGRVQLLRMRLEPPSGQQEKRKSMLELHQGLEIIEKAALDGAETVRRIQEFSRRRADDKGFTRVDINELIKHALEFTRAKWKDEAESKGIKIVVKKELFQIPPTSGSEAELREVFINLINNALDAMPQGGRLTIKTFKIDHSIGVTVKDTGIGIPQDMRERIFDPFFTTKGPRSTGLGLSVSYGIINRHRGTITVDSVEGEGTTFTIRLPISEGMVKEEKSELMPVTQKKARILVVEDEEGVRNVLKDILTAAGHEVEIAYDGNQGIALFKKKEYDLVFTDLGMPVMSGWQVAEKVKGINKRVPVALITGWNVELKGSEMKENYVDLIIKKPFAVNQVIRLVQEGMELRERFNAA